MTTTVSRRSILGGLAAAGLLSALPQAAPATGRITSIIVAPHPDDEVLRLGPYVARTYHERGDQFILLACSSGGGSGVARGMGWTPEYERDYRMGEQASAWSRLTGGTGQVVRLNQWDKGVKELEVRKAINALIREHAPTSSAIEVYAAAHFTDHTGAAGIDHRAVAYAVKNCDAPIKRWSLAPGSFKTGNYRPGRVPAKHRATVSRSVDLGQEAYEGFGQKSVPALFKAARNQHSKTVSS